MIIGITGKIGSGKHTAARILEEQGFFLIDADKLAHDLYLRGSKIWHQLADAFGEKIIGKDDEIDRSELGKIVFADSEKLRKLNSIVHPDLKSFIKAEIKRAQNQNKKNIVVVAALADELNLKSLVDKVLLVQAPLNKRIELLTENRGMEEKEILKRNELQKETSFYDFKILNEGSLEEFKNKLSFLSSSEFHPL